MSQTSLGFNADEEEDQDALPLNAEDRDSESLTSPAFEKAKPDSTVADADEAAQAMSSAADADTEKPEASPAEPAEESAPTEQAPQRAVRTKVGSLSDLLPSTAFPEGYTPRSEYAAQFAADQERRAQQTSLDTQRLAREINTSDPYQADDGRWVRKLADPISGDIHEVDLLAAGAGKISPNGNISVPSSLGPVVIGTDPYRKALSDVIAQRLLATSETDQFRAKVGTLRSQQSELTAQMDAFGAEPGLLDQRVAKAKADLDLNPDDDKLKAKFDAAQTAQSTWRAANPEYGFLDKQNDQLSAILRQTTQDYRDSQARAATALSNVNYVKAIGTLPPPGMMQSNGPTDVSLPQLQLRAADIIAATPGTTHPAALRQALGEAQSSGMATAGGIPIADSIKSADATLVSKPIDTSVKPEGIVQSFMRPLLSGLAPAAGTAAGGVLGAGIAGTLGLSTGPGAVVAAGLGDVAGGALGGMAVQKIQNAIMGDKWTQQNAAQIEADMRANPIATNIGGALPAFLSMLGGGKVVKDAAQGVLDRSMKLTGGNPTFLAKIMASIPGNLILGARMSAGTAGEQAASGQADYSSIIPAAIKGALTMGPVAFIPGATSLLGSVLAKAPADAAVLSLSNALYDHFVSGKPLDPAAIAKETGTSIPGFMLLNAISSLMGGHGAVMPKAAIDARTADAANTLATLSKQAEDLRAKIATAQSTGDVAALSQHQAALDQTQAGMHEASKTVLSQIPDKLKKVISGVVSPDIDHDATQAMLDNSSTHHFGLMSLGEGVRDEYLPPERQQAIESLAKTQGIDPAIAQRYADQMTGARAVQDLQKVLTGGSLEASKAKALEAAGMLQRTQETDGTTKMRVTDDAQPLLPSSLQKGVVLRPDALAYTQTAGNPADALSAHVRAGEARAGQTAEAAHSTLTQPPADRSFRVNVHSRSEAGSAIGVDRIPISAPNADEAVRRARAQVEGSGRMIIKATAQELKGGQKEAPAEPSDHPTTKEKPRTTFKTSQGSEYTVDENGNTVRLKKSEGRGHGEVHDARPVVFLSPQGHDAIMQAGREGHRVVLGTRNVDDTFTQIRPKVGEDLRSIPNLHVLAIDKQTGDVKAGARATTTPEVGKHPFELAYKGDEKHWHMGNQIVEISHGEGEGKAEEKEQPRTAVEMTGLARKTYVQNRALFEELGVGAPEIDENAPSAVAMDGSRLVINPRLLEAESASLAGKGKSAEAWLNEAMVGEEFLHRVFIKAEQKAGLNWTETGKEIWNDPTLDPELKKGAAESYHDFDQLSDAQKGAEVLRMVMQGRWRGTITEAIFKAVERFVSYLRGLDAAQVKGDVLRGALERAEAVLTEVRARVGEDNQLSPPAEIAPQERTVADESQAVNPPSATEEPGAASGETAPGSEGGAAEPQEAHADVETPSEEATEQTPAVEQEGDETQLAASSAKEDDDSEPFYSQLTRTVQSLPQEMMTVGQAKAAITKGGKPAEIKQQGIFDDPLSPLYIPENENATDGDSTGGISASNDRAIPTRVGKAIDGETNPLSRKVTKQELISYALERQAKVQDVTLGRSEKERSEDDKKQADFYEEHLKNGRWDSPKNEQTWREMIAARDEGRTHFESYQLPGADEGTYREQFVTWPQRTENDFSVVQQADDKYAVRSKHGAVVARNLATEAEAQKIADGGKTPTTDWNDGHGQYSDIANPIVRIRRNIRTDADGKRTYFLEEMQGPNKDNQTKMPPEIQKRIYEIGLKRALRDAVDEGADKLAWTTGDQQAERYDLSKHVDSVMSVDWPAAGKDMVLLTAYKGPNQVLKETVPKDKIADYVGKEAAQKLEQQERDPMTGHRMIEGDDLKVGGAGLARLYDQTLPRIANEIAKKTGAKVGTASIETGTGKNFEKWFKNNYGNLSDHSARDIQNARQEYAELNPAKDESNTVHSLEIPKEWKDEAPQFALYASRTGGDQAPADKLRAAYERVLAKNANGFPDVDIADVIKEAGLPVNKGKVALHELYKDGQVQLSGGDHSLASDEKRAAGIKTHADYPPNLLMRFEPKEPLAASKTDDADKSPQDRAKENVGLAVSIANEYRNIPGVEIGDVVGEAKTALMKAARGYDATRAEPFSAYAGAAIRNRLNDLFGRESKYQSQTETSLDEPAHEGEGETRGQAIPGASGESVTAPVDKQETHKALMDAINGLAERPREILMARLRGKTLEDIGRDMLGGVTKERARQVVDTIMGRVKSNLAEKGLTRVESDGILYASKTDRDGKNERMPEDKRAASQKAGQPSPSGSKEGVFVRFGDIPPDGISHNHVTGEPEKGTSVYRAERTKDGLKLLPKNNQELGTLAGGIGARPLFVVSGNHIGHGSDGEPILTGAKATPYYGSIETPLGEWHFTKGFKNKSAAQSIVDQFNATKRPGVSVIVKKATEESGFNSFPTEINSSPRVEKASDGQWVVKVGLRSGLLNPSVWTAEIRSKNDAHEVMPEIFGENPDSRAPSDGALSASRTEPAADGVLAHAMREAAKQLSDDQREVLDEVQKGRNVQQITDKLGITRAEVQQRITDSNSALDRAKKAAVNELTDHIKQTEAAPLYALRDRVNEVAANFAKKLTAAKAMVSGLKEGFEFGKQQHGFIERQKSDMGGELRKLIGEALPVDERAPFLAATTRLVTEPVALRSDGKNEQRLQTLFKKGVVIAGKVLDQAEALRKKSIVEGIQKIAGRVSDSPGVDVEYQRRIQGLVKNLDFSKPTAKTTAEMQGTKEFMDRNAITGHGVPAEVVKNLDRLNRLPVRDLPTHVLESIMGDMALLEKLGRLKVRTREAIAEARQEAAQAFIAAKKTTPLEMKPILKAQPGERLPWMDRVRNIVTKAQNYAKVFDKALLPMAAVADGLGEGKGHLDGGLERVVHGPVDTAYNMEIVDRQALMKPVEDLIARHKLSEQDGERLGVYATLQQEGGEQRLREMGVEQRVIDSNRSISGPVAEAYKEWQKIEQWIYPRVAKTARDLFNQHVDKVQNYFPMLRDHESFKPDQAPIQTESGETIKYDPKAMLRGLIDDFNPMPKKRTEAGFTTERVKNAATPIRLDGFAVMRRHVQDALHFIHMQPVLSDAAKVVDSPIFEAKYGDGGQKIYREYLDTVARQGGVDATRRIAALDMLRKRLGMGAIAFRLASNIKHISNVPFAMFHVGPDYFVKGARAALGDDAQAWIAKNMAEISARHGAEPAQEELESATGIPKGLGKAWDTGRKYGFWVARNIDRIAAQSTAIGAYQRELALAGKDPDNWMNEPVDRTRVNKALTLMRRSVASPLYKDIPQALARGTGVFENASVARTLLAFQNIFLDQWSNLRHDLVRSGIQEKNPGRALAMGATLASVILLETGIVQGTRAATNAVTGNKDKDKEGFGDTLLKDSLRRFPFMGQLMQMALYGRTGVPLFDSITESAKAAGGAITGKKPVTREKNAVKAAAGVATLAGVPGAGQVGELIQKAMPSESKSR